MSMKHKSSLQKLGREKRKMDLMQRKAHRIQTNLTLRNKTANNSLQLSQELSQCRDQLHFLQNHASNLQVQLDTTYRNEKN